MDFTYFGALFITMKIIIYVTLPLLLFAVVIAYCLLLNRKLLNNLIEILINIPIIFPPVGIGFLLVLCFSRNSLLGRYLNVDIVFSFSGICIAAFLTGIPFIARAVMAGIGGSINDLCDASYTLGKSRLNTFLVIVIPLLKNNIMQGFILAIGRIVGEVGITMMVGGNIAGKTTTVSLAIYNAVLDGENDRALVLAGVLFVFSLLIFYMLRYIGNKVYTVY